MKRKWSEQFLNTALIVIEESDKKPAFLSIARNCTFYATDTI